MRTTVWMPLGLALATSLAAPPSLADAAEQPVFTYVRLLIGRTDTVAAKERVLVVPGTIVLPGESAEQKASDLLRLIDELKDSYRLDRLEPAPSTAIQFEIGKPERLPSVPDGPTAEATLLAADAKKAVFRVTLREAGRTLAEPTISIRRGGRAIVGSRDGAAAPYLFVLIEALPEPLLPVGPPGSVGTPKLLHKVTPQYPQEARQAKLDGLVLLEATIGADGSVTTVKPIRSEPMGLTEAAVDAVKQWRYQPPRESGCQCDQVTMTVTVRFMLQ